MSVPSENQADATSRVSPVESPVESPNDSSVEAYQAADSSAFAVAAETVEASSEFVGRWRTVVSTTNWEKGRIICDWRASLEASGAEITEYSDEAWSQLVGGVTGQHVGRLRRVYQRFGETVGEYEGLYWSHFQAATEWDDAEMWLEGALSNGWSVSQMRGQRWEVVGSGDLPAEESPDDSAIASGLAEVIDLVDPVADSAPRSSSPEVESRADDRDGDQPSADRDDLDSPTAERETSEPEPAESVRPFAELPELPDDVADAFEQFKLAILNHKLGGWAEVSQSDLLGVLESLKQLALAPSED